jgi:hypothetical protein
MKYDASELLVFLIALAVLFSLGTSVMVLFILIQECGRWSVRKYKEVTGTAALSQIYARILGLATPYYGRPQK